jgi:surface antigen
MKTRIFTALCIGQFLFACLSNVVAAPPCGTVLATYRGVAAKSNGEYQGKPKSCDVRGTYGLQYQCVEYVKRFYAQALSVDTSDWSADAVDFFARAKSFGLMSFPNEKSSSPPAPDDIIVFDNGGLGHVAIVLSVSGSVVTCIEQNWSSTGFAALQLNQQNGLYSIQPRGPYQVLGWLRRASNQVVFQPGPNTGKDIWTTSVYYYAPCSYPYLGGGLYDAELRVGGWGDLYYSLLQFDLTGLPTHATSVTLQLFCYSSNQGTPTPMYIDRITQFWWDWQTSGTGCDYDRLWWADRPSAVQWSATIFPAPVVGQWYSMDITDLYNAWQSGQYPNYGLQLRPVYNWDNFNFFYSSRYAGDMFRPKLIIQQ